MKQWGIVAVMMVALAAWPRAQASSGVERELIGIENDWSQASVKRDGAALQRFYADEYVFTDAEGVVTNKTQEIESITGGIFQLMSYRFDHLVVHVYGDVAVVTGQNTIKGFWQDIRRDISGPYRFTDVFVKRNGRWLCVASQASRVTEK